MGAEISSINEAKTEISEEPQLDNIPDEIILKILSNLDIVDLLQCAQVCKRINLICTDETLYHKMDFSRRKIPTRVIELVLRRGCNNLNLRMSKLQGKFSEPLPKVVKHLDIFKCKYKYHIGQVPHEN